MTTIEMKRDAILAGLRLLQANPYNRQEIEAIRTNSGAHAGLTDTDIDQLCEELNRGDAFVVLQEAARLPRGRMSAPGTPKKKRTRFV